jgi:signal transduction histidine kinase
MWQAFAIVFCMAILNALRRSIFNLAADPQAGVSGFVESTALGVLVGSTMVVAVAATLKRYPEANRKQYAAVAAAVLLSSAVGVLMKDWYEWAISSDSAVLRSQFSLAQYFLPDWLRYAVPGALIAGACLYFRLETQTAAEAHRCTLESAEMARQAAEAQLRLLEAQNEPHFLFNSLASVKRLFRTDARAAERMLDDLMRYLAVALPRIREAESSLGGEADLASAFLAIHRVRMGRRMEYSLRIAPELRDARVPPFMLLTLIENAIKHAISPLPEGGVVDVSAQAHGGQLVLEVRDTGRGFTGASGAGTGLAYMRARLGLLYLSNASLGFSGNKPTCVVARVVLPLEQVPAGQAP